MVEGKIKCKERMQIILGGGGAGCGRFAATS